MLSNNYEILFLKVYYKNSRFLKNSFLTFQKNYLIFLLNKPSLRGGKKKKMYNLVAFISLFSPGFSNSFKAQNLKPALLCLNLKNQAF